MYAIREEELLVAHDAHPEYASTAFARALPGEHVAIQHHRAHVSSVLAERGEWDRDVLGVAFDGTGYGDDGTIWGGEFFSGSVRGGFARVAHVRSAPLPGGDAAARFPVQAAAGFLSELSDVPDLTAAPFAFPARYGHARALIAKNVRVFRTTSMGRLFDAVAALLGFTREITFEGQAAMWLEHLATTAGETAPYAFPLHDRELDYRPLLAAVIDDRVRGRDTGSIARAFHASIVDAVVRAHAELARGRVLAASGGVFQNRLLVELLHDRLGPTLWVNRVVPANDGGLCLGQAALAAARVP
jgi:hydrogenase maturation protein HypF